MVIKKKTFILDQVGHTEVFVKRWADDDGHGGIPWG